MQSFKQYFYELVLEANVDKRIEFLFNKWYPKLKNLFEKHWDLFKTEAVMFGLAGSEALSTLSTAKPINYEDFVRNFIRKIVNDVDPDNGKYSDWVIRGLLSIDVNESSNKRYFINFWEDSYKIREDIENWKKYKKIITEIDPKYGDINAFSNYVELSGLFRFSKILQSKIREQDNEQKMKDAEKDAEKIYNSANYLILVPKTVEASCAYGRGTRWCTASTGSYNYFNQYSQKGPLYIIIDKKVNEKYQFHFQTEQYMNADDSQVDLKEFFETHEELKNPLIDLAIKNNNINFVLNVDIDLALEKMESFEEPVQEKFVRENSLCAFRLGLKKPEFVNKTQPLFIFENNSVSIRTNKGSFADLAEQFVASSRRGNETANAKKILGDGLDPFYDHGVSYDSDYWDWLDTKSQLLMKKYIWAVYNTEISSISEAEALVDENDDEYIKDLLTHCFDDAGRFAYESAYHDAAMNAIFDALGKTFEWRNNTIVFTKYSYKQIQDIFDNFMEHFSEDAIPVSLPHDFLSQLETYLRDTDQLTIPDFDRASNNAYPTKKEQGDVFNERFRNELEIPESQRPELDLSSFKNYFKWAMLNN